MLPYSLSDRFLGQLLQDRRLNAPGRGWMELALQFAPGLGADVRPNLAFFGAERRDPGGETVPEYIFPHALRITIDVFDSERRLDRPIRHVMVVPVGG